MATATAEKDQAEATQRETYAQLEQLSQQLSQSQRAHDQVAQQQRATTQQLQKAQAAQAVAEQSAANLRKTLASQQEELTQLRQQRAQDAQQRELAPTVTNSIGMEFVRISAGTFQMGSTKGEDDEQPVHEVTISKPFYLGKYEVTQGQWEAVMGENPSRFTSDPNRPVENVSWNMVQEFIGKLNANAKEKDQGAQYRLPTEAEWEYAARAGTTTAYSFSDDSRQLGKYTWYGESWNSGSTHHVGQLQPNPWSLYDMHGNVWKWVQDWYARDYYKQSPSKDPPGPDTGKYRVVRGGSFHDSPVFLRSARRVVVQPVGRFWRRGFRCIRVPPQP